VDRARKRADPIGRDAPHGAAPVGIRSASGLLILLAILLPVALMAVGAALAWRDAWRGAQASVALSAETVAEYGQRLLTLHAVAAGRMDALLRGLSDAEIREREADLHAEFRRLVDEIPGTEAGYVLDRHGTLLVSANTLPVPRGPGLAADRDFFMALAADGAPALHVSQVHASRVDGAVFFAISRRRTQTGNTDLPACTFDGLVNLSIFPAHLAQALRRLVVGPDDIAVLMRTDGELLATSTGAAGPGPAQREFLAATGALPGTAVFATRAATDDVERLAAARHVEGWPVYAMVARPRAATLAAWWRAVGDVLVIGIPAMLLLLLAAFAVRRGETRLAAANAALEARVAARTAALVESGARLNAAVEGAGTAPTRSILPATPSGATRAPPKSGAGCCRPRPGCRWTGRSGPRSMPRSIPMTARPSRPPGPRWPRAERQAGRWKRGCASRTATACGNGAMARCWRATPPRAGRW
jgi:hypothetical protein